MTGKSPGVDEYIAGSANFARPILERLREIVHEAAPEIEEDIKWGMPAFVHKGLLGNMAVQATFDGFSYTHRKEYIEWLTEAKREATCGKRLATAIEWMAEGKPRNWKYMPKK